MHISRNDLQAAAIAAGINDEQTSMLWKVLSSRSTQAGKPRFDLANVAYYIGALVVIGAMGWFMSKAWDGMGGPGLAVVAACYAVCFVMGGRTLWAQGLRIPGGLLFTMAVCMVPLATFGIERWTGFWPASDPGSYSRFHPRINGSWIIMEAATILAGLAALRFWRFPFLTAPIAYSLWFMSMDIAELLAGHTLVGWREREVISMVFGFVMLLSTYTVDIQGGAEDYTFWGYLFGLLAFWGGLSALDSNSELGKFAYCLVNVGLIFCSLLLRRRAFIVFGAIGFFGYIGHLAHRVFENSVLFPFALTLVGLGIIYIGLQYQRRRDRIEAYVQTNILPRFRGFVPPRVLAD
jgi:hypothetical protein